jgi:hypothetical protein
VGSSQQKDVMNSDNAEEIVFYGQNPYHCIRPYPAEDFEQATGAKFFGMIINNGIRFGPRIWLILWKFSRNL